jgi:hypothetical protein
MGRCGKHETAYIECIIVSLLMSSVIYNSSSSREVIRVRFCKNILSFLLPKNDSQVVLSIHRISSIEFFLLKQGLQIKSGFVTSRHDLQEEMNNKILALGYVPIFY